MGWLLQLSAVCAPRARSGMCGTLLLNVARPPQIALDNAYFEENFAKGAAPLLKICIELGVTGSIDVDRIQEMGKRLDADNHSSCSSVSTSQQTPACNL